MVEREPTFACGMCGCCGEFMEPWDLCEHCSKAPGVDEFLRRVRAGVKPGVGQLYRAQLGPHPNDWSYVLTVGQVSDNFVCHRVSLLLDDQSVLRVHEKHLGPIGLLKPEDFNDPG